VLATNREDWMQKDFPKIARVMGGPDADYPGGLREVKLKGGFAQQPMTPQRCLGGIWGVTDPTQRSRSLREASDQCRDEGG